MNPTTLYRYLTLWMLAFMLAACAAIGQTPATTPEGNLRYAQAALTGVYKTIGEAATDGSITGPEARTFFNQVQPAKDGLDDADAILSGLKLGTTASVLDKVNLALGILRGISTQLKKRLPPASVKSLTL